MREKEKLREKKEQSFLLKGFDQLILGESELVSGSR